MKYKYTKFIPDDLEGIDLEQLLSKLSDLLLASGFDNPYEPDPNAHGHTRQELQDAIIEALLSNGLLSPEQMERLLGEPADGDSTSGLEQLLDKLIDRMGQQGYLTPQPEQGTLSGGQDGTDLPPVKFEVTDKGIDFLGYRALRDLLGSLGRSSAGRHDTRDMATGIDAGGAVKPYEFGDTMNLDPVATLLSSVGRNGLPEPGQGFELDYPDLHVTQGEYQSSCATVVMLDCSHSMILYGEDRFTPAKRVALALANLIRHQYPGDALNAVLFHDSAEEVPVEQLARVRVGPYYTNTREGLRLARRVLERQKKDMKQIVMITDGKPSAITRPDGQIYRNAFGLDPYIVSETFAEVAACRKAGIMINTFMLARDYELMAFVRRVAQICHGKAYFTTPMTLGQYVLTDYMNNKTRTVH
ncbi:VWA domain-containing protein [Luteitalea sp.]|uniref:vWA domain-containing protein n=1 Tax=Luteitalea sp. TaxID=2004800 RepID=UPI000A48070B|nr:VWA domain-containing protein [Luteitalea sp.]